MITILLPLLLLLAPTATNGEFNFGACGGSMEHIWLDIIILIDNSSSMNSTDIQSTAGDIKMWFGQKPITIGTRHSDPRTVRLGVIKYDKNATLIADLDKYQNYDDVNNGIDMAMNHNVTSIKESNLGSALLLANSTFNAGRTNNYRTNFKKLIIVYAAAAPSVDAVVIAKALKNEGVTIAVISFSRSQVLTFEDVASQDQASVFGLVNFAEILTDANCFCRPGWYNAFPGTSDVHSSCFWVSPATASWSNAKFNCMNLDRQASLASEWTKLKHRLVRKIYQNVTGQGDDAVYHIGLNYISGVWYWEQPAGQMLLKLDNTNAPNDLSWNPKAPSAPTTNPGVSNMIGSDGQIGWQNINSFNFNANFVCEMDACDTDHYCEFDLYADN